MKIKLANITFRIIDDFIWLLILPAQGYYVTNYSTSTTVARNAAIFWIFYSLRLVKFVIGLPTLL